MPRCRDPRRAVDVHPDIALVGDERLARVQAHAHPHRARRERSVPVGRSRECVRGFRERDKERVALRVDLDAAMPRERVAEHAAMLGERIGVARRRARAGAASTLRRR